MGKAPDWVGKEIETFPGGSLLLVSLSSREISPVMVVSPAPLLYET